MKKLLLLALVALLVGAAIVLFEGDIPASEVDARYTNGQSKFLTLADGARIHFRDQGDPAALPVVLVHGSNASLHTWEPWVSQLGTDYRLITLDLPAHGLTGAVPAEAYDSAAQIATVKSIADHLELERFVVGGNSMGGGVSWRYALQYPESVVGLLLIDASGLWQWRSAAVDDPKNDSQDDEGPLAFRLLQQPWFRAIAGRLDTRLLVEQGLKSAFTDQSKVSEEMIELYYQMSMREGTRAATLRRFDGFGQLGNDLDDARLAQLTMPTLILWGERDALIPVSIGERFAELLPDTQLIVYPDVGHIPMEEIPEQSAADVRKFLQTRVTLR